MTQPTRKWHVAYSSKR